MTERERFEKLMDKMLMTERERQILESYVAMLATFAVKNDIALSTATLVGSELVSEMGQSLLDRDNLSRLRRNLKPKKRTI